MSLKAQFEAQQSLERALQLQPELLKGTERGAASPRPH